MITLYELVIVYISFQLENNRRGVEMLLLFNVNFFSEIRF